MQNGQMDPVSQYEDVFEQLTETNLSEGSRELLRNLVTKDLVLAYFNDAEITEMKWKLRTIKDVYLDMHPSGDCIVTGDDRAAINDDRGDTLTELTGEDIIVIDTFFTQLISRLTRARQMKQQEMMNTQIAERRDGSDDSGGGGLIDRITGK